jgi:hypothetical protein
MDQREAEPASLLIEQGEGQYVGTRSFSVLGQHGEKAFGPSAHPDGLIESKAGILASAPGAEKGKSFDRGQRFLPPPLCSSVLWNNTTKSNI